jgi:protein TonB
MPLSRFPVAIAFALVVTFFLFYAMQALVSVSGELQEGSAPPTVEFVRLKRDTSPEVAKREPPKREKPEQPPPPPQMNLAERVDPGGTTGEIVSLADATEQIAEAAAVGSGDGGAQDAVPLVRVDPDYPPRARQRGIEGWVTLQFTIAPTGSVQGASVLDANPTGVFEEAALRAVNRWRYNPKVEDGVPVARTGVKVKLTFTLPRS